MDYSWEKCPHCGKEIQLPFHRDAIRCIFCQQEIDVKKLLLEKEALTKSFSMEKDLPAGLFEPQVPMKNFSKDSYEKTFAAYYGTAEPTLQKFAAYYQAAGERREDIEAFAGYAVDAIQGRLDERGIRYDTVEYFSYVYLIVAYLCPAILKAAQPFSDMLADEIIGLWNQKYPKNPIKKATYETVYGGFKRKLCFITTAVCRTLDKPDCCEELTALRAFRDEYLLCTENGRAKVNEYYMLAPLIVEEIDRSGKADEAYRSIYSEYLTPCLKELRENRFDDCEKRYEAMLRDLQRAWFH